MVLEYRVDGSEKLKNGYACAMEAVSETVTAREFLETVAARAKPRPDPAIQALMGLARGGGRLDVVTGRGWGRPAVVYTEVREDLTLRVVVRVFRRAPPEAEVTYIAPGVYVRAEARDEAIAAWVAKRLLELLEATQ